MKKNTSTSSFQDYISNFPTNLKAVAEKVDKPSFAAGGATGAVAGVAVTVLCRHLKENGAFDGVSDSIERFQKYLKNFSDNNLEVVEVAAEDIGVSVNGDADADVVIAEIIDDAGLEV